MEFSALLVMVIFYKNIQLFSELWDSYPYFERFMVIFLRLFVSDSWNSQMCVGTFSRHASVLFGPFLCLGSSSLTLFCPACFKKTFCLLGFVRDWILCIKRCSARDGGDGGAIHRREGAENEPHKQRISRLKCWHGDAEGQETVSLFRRIAS